jgi:hypothetical protein
VTAVAFSPEDYLINHGPPTKTTDSNMLRDDDTKDEEGFFFCSTLFTVDEGRKLDDWIMS